MLRRHADKLLINGDYANVLLDDQSGAAAGSRYVDIKGYGIIGDGATLLSANKYCSTAETLGVTDVTVIIPTSCECPYEWCLTIECLPDLQLYETQTTFPSSKVYCYEDPSGATPTDTDTAAAIAAAINADPFACVTATVAGAVITLTAKSGTNGFNAFTASGTVAVTTPHAKAILDYDAMTRLFPIHPGDFGSQPTLPVSGATYCKWNVVIRGREDVQDVDGANHWNKYEKELDLYILNDGSVDYTALETALDTTLGT